MTITWGTTQLCDGTRTSAGYGLQIGLAGNSQIQGRVRATNVSTYNRSNWSNTVGFSVSVLYDSIGEAETAMADMSVTLKGIGKADLTVVFSDDTGRCYARNAVLTSFSASNIGVTVNYGYAFSAERIER